MSQQKDSDSGDNLEKPTSPSVPETTPDGSWADVAISESFRHAGSKTESDTETAASEPVAAAEPTVVLDAPAGPTVAGPAATPPAGLDVRRFVTVGAAALLAVSVVAAGIIGFLWFGDHKDENRAHARDAALTDARQAAINLMSINPDDIDGSLANIRSSMTGELLKQQEEGQDQLKQTAQDSKTRIKADVEGLTLTSLNTELDHASAFAVLKITRSWPGGQPATFRQLWTLDLVKVGDAWKAEKAQNLGEPVPLGTGTAQQPSSTPTPAPGN
ncbi:hypothetical protein [Nocardia seriolae]|uniref:Mce-associated membrane protein n=1 Tax=Nocardia seriolae TaxID=37332 RepID=A0ABC9YX44_9NOCA|nr:hypothetical protein [Nocardia seriolae]APA94133.1 hypothetical protein NS506_00042 [Nocardia seriolae]OJF83044.1 hypothetical protein NS14008_32875 [Nocardia seriolae]PSK30541.1 hypothetical protein C6575_15420 [Nocardia seriolae]QOW32800.1 hypothetical protein IMZ23_33655 [Nocardia seriolae]QUN20409.1 hypothetical protein KEC46_14710 [Nocardia seriolae]